jgi:ATP synthase protein I
VVVKRGGSLTISPVREDVVEEVRKVVPWAVPVVVACAVVSALSAGVDGLIGALVGGVLVCVFFVSTPLALGPIATTVPHLSLVAAMMFFATKILALLALMTILLDPDGIGRHVHEGSLGGTVIVTTLLWTVLQVRASRRTRQPLYDLHDSAG